MRLTLDMPGAQLVAGVWLDGVEQKRCFAADDVAGVALCGVLDANGFEIFTPLHRDWQPGEFDYQGVVARWVRGHVDFRFYPPDLRAEAESHWKEFIPRDAIWALADLIAAQEPPL